MINDVRNTVLSIISKDNRGYITPDEFNLFAKQAQLEIFEQYIYSYSNSINKQNARMFGEGYTDVPKNIGEVIDEFSVLTTLTYSIPYFLLTSELGVVPPSIILSHKASPSYPCSRYFCS